MTDITKGNNRKLPFNKERLNNFIKRITSRFPHIESDEYSEKTIRAIEGKEEHSAEQISNDLMLNALERVGVEEGQHPDWSKVAAQVHLNKLYKEAAYNRSYSASDKYDNFYGLLKTLAQKGIYNPALLEKYTKEEIDALEEIIEPEKDNLFNYIALYTLSDRYLARDHEWNLYELPQERYLVIAMTLMQNEPKEFRLDLVREAYWALSNQYMTVATPTFANAGKSYGQLILLFYRQCGG